MIMRILFWSRLIVGRGSLHVGVRPQDVQLEERNPPSSSGCGTRAALALATTIGMEYLYNNYGHTSAWMEDSYDRS